jgi:hypothetical protein
MQRNCIIVGFPINREFSEGSISKRSQRLVRNLFNMFKLFLFALVAMVVFAVALAEPEPQPSGVIAAAPAILAAPGLGGGILLG